MAGNTFGRLFTVTTFGESHGPAIGCIVDGCPPGMLLSEEDIQPDLDRRRPGSSRFVTQRRESDTVEILSGLFEGKTTGTPIALLIRNTDQKSKDYKDIADIFRPGHADYTYWKKYGIRDYRGGGRSSARETAARVAAGAIAKKWLRLSFQTEIMACVTQIGTIRVPIKDILFSHQNPFCIADPDKIEEVSGYIDSIRHACDSIGARLHVQANHVPVGLGAPVFDRLDADIAYAMMSINAVKGVEIGSGFASIEQKGSEHADEMSEAGFLSNHAGGVLGGISTGERIELSIAVKPTPSIASARQSVNLSGQPVTIATHGRHDPCVGLRAAPIAEAMLALVLIDHALIHRAQVQLNDQW